MDKVFLKPIDVRLNVKPIFPFLIHNDSYEGPCRTGDEDRLNPEREKSEAKKRFDTFKREIKDKLTSEFVNVLEPVFIEHKTNWIIEEKEFNKLETDMEETDLYLVDRGADLAQFVAVRIGERYKKPVAMVGEERHPGVPMGCDAISHLRAKNLEGYVLLNHSELDHLLFLLKVRKSVSQTKILRVADEQNLDNVNGNIADLKRFKKKFGIDWKDISIGRFAKEMDTIAKDKDYQKEAGELTDKLIKNAQKVHMKREFIISSVNFYLAAKSLMQQYGCNAFTVNCFEICPDLRIAYRRKAVPCLTHTLLKDEGIPSACEGDINVLLTMMFLIYISKKSVYMGNIYMINRKENIMGVLHDVPGIKMKGLDQPDLPYEIRNFTNGGWGATIRHNFALDKSEKVMVARFDPLGNKILVVKGEIVGCEKFDEISCTLTALIKVPDVAGFFHKAADFGNHSVMVYGDYTRELKELGNLMGFEVVEHYERAL